MDRKKSKRGEYFKYDREKVAFYYDSGVDARPELTGCIENPEDYDTIFIGFSTWLAYHKRHLAILNTVRCLFFLYVTF